MKPLTIDELKALKVGDWVWITNENGRLGSYVIKAEPPYGDDNDKTFSFNSLSISNTYPYAHYGKTWLAYKNKEQAEAKGEIVELPNGWLDTLKLLTCAASCYAVIDDMIAKGMQNSKELLNLFMNIPRVQGSTLQWSLEDLANSHLNYNEIKGFEEVLNAMPKFKAELEKLAELKGEPQ